MSKNVNEQQERAYHAEVVDCTKELSPIQKVRYADMASTVKLEDALSDGHMIIDVDFSYVVSIHNENSDDKDYENYVVVDKTGAAFRTGSRNFYEKYMDIRETLEDAGISSFKIECMLMPSKKREGKSFITCVVAE